MRVLDAALMELSADSDPTKIDATVLNRAAQIAVECYSKKVAYNIGQYMEELIRFMSENRLLSIPITWRNPIKRPENPDRIGPEHEARRLEKLPTDTVLQVLPKAYWLAREPVDILMSSISLLLLAAPSRINELLRVPADCEVYMEQQKGKGTAYGLRWLTSKGAAHMIKWQIPSMHELVEEAIGKIRKHTENARNIARWYENNPDKIYLPSEFEYLRKIKIIPLSELVRLFQLRDMAAGKDWCKARKIKLYQDNGVWLLSFSELEKTILSMFPRHFPICDRSTKLKYSESMMLVRLNELHSVRAMNPCMFEAISINTVNYHLGGRVEYGGASIFTRLGFEEPDGSPIKVTTHQFRHYVNTLMQEGCVSQLDIALHSGRKDIRQNDAYNHMTSDQILALMPEAADDESNAVGALPKIPNFGLVSREDFARRRLPAAHVTDIGFCTHDFVMEPCKRYRQCIMCEDLVCIKGVDEHAACLRQNLAETRELLRQAEEAADEGYAGAGRWAEHQMLAVERMEALCEHLDDPSVPDGAVIQLAPPHNPALAKGRNNPCLKQTLRLGAGSGV